MIALCSLLLLALQGTTPDSDPMVAAGGLLEQASAHYWFATAEHDDLAALDGGVDLLTRARDLLGDVPASDQKRQLLLTIDALHGELLAQREMGFDTLEGVFPLFVHLATGIGRDVLVDDPWIPSSTEAANEISEVIGQTWRSHSQIETVVRTRVRHDAEIARKEAGGSRSLSNELAYVLEDHPRLYYNNDADVLSILGPEMHASFHRGTKDPALYEALLDGLETDRFLLIDLDDRGTAPPLWFSVAWGTLIERGKGPVGTVRAMGFARDRRARLPWMVGATLSLLIISLIAAIAGTRGSSRPQRAIGAGLLFIFALASSAVGLRFIGQLLPAPAFLVTEVAWAPLALAAVAAWGPALAIVLLGARLGSLGQVILPGGRPWNAGWLPLALGCAVPVTWVLFLERPADEASLLTALLALSLIGAARMLDVQGRVSDKFGGTVLFGAWLALVILVAFEVRGPALNFAAWSWIVGLGVIGLLGIAASIAGLTSGFVTAAAAGLMAIAAAMTADATFLALPALAAGIILVARPRREGVESPAEVDVTPASAEIGKSTLKERLRRIYGQEGRFSPWPGFEEAVKETVQEFESKGMAVLVLVGPSGAGKTRSANEFFLRLGVKDDARMKGRCRDPKSAPQPMAPFTDALAYRVAHAQGQAQEWLKVLGGLLPLPGILDSLSESKEGGEGRINRVALSMFQALEKGAGGGRAGLEIDAGEHLDKESEDVLKALMKLVLAQDRARSPLKLVIQISAQKRIPFLENLRLREVQVGGGFLKRFLCDVVALDDDLGSLMEGVAGDLEMTPLWALEWIELAIAEGSIDGEAKGIVVGPLDAEGRARLRRIMPRSVDAASKELLSKLPAQTQQWLRCGALAGMEFNVDALESVFGVTRFELVEGLQFAENAGVLEDLDRDGEFGFRSGVYRRCLTSALTKPNGGPTQTALELHKELARHYEGCWQETRLSPDLYRAAAQASLADGGSADAVSLSAHAGEVAASRGDWSEGLRAADCILSRADTHASVDDRLRAMIARLQCESGAHPRDERPLESALEALRKVDAAVDADPSLCAELRIEAALRLQDRDELDASVRLAKQVREDPAASALTALTALKAAHVLGRGLWLGVRNAKDPGAREYERAVEILKAARDHDVQDRDVRQELAKLENTLGDVLADPPGNDERSAEALECFHRSLEIKREVGDRLGQAISLGSIGRYHLFGPLDELKANADAAIKAFETNLALSLELGDLDGRVKMPNFIGAVLIKIGRTAEAIPYVEESLALAQRLEREKDAAFALKTLAEALEAEGRTAEAHQHREELKKITESHPRLKEELQ